MGTILDRLKEYFENTSLEQVKADWESTEKYDMVISPPAETFIVETQKLIDVGKQEDLLTESIINNFENPDFSSDFFLIKILFHGKSQKSQFLY